MASEQGNQFPGHQRAFFLPLLFSPRSAEGHPHCLTFVRPSWEEGPTAGSQHLSGGVQGGSAGLRLSLLCGPESQRTRPPHPRSGEGRSQASSEFLVLVPQGGEVTMSTPPLPPSSLPATSLPRNSPARFLIHTIRSSISHRETDISYLGFRWAWV